MNPKFNLSAYYGGQNITINQCMDPNSGGLCAWADAAQAPVNNPQQAEQYFLACSLTPNPIALCYYSGMPGLPDKTPSCTLSQSGNAAQCNCYEISANNPPGQTGEYAYSYVEITSILNQDVYNKTVSECVQNGVITCLTLANLLADPPNLTPMQAPTLCAALTSQPNGLFPGADLVSDFSEIGMSTVNNPGIPPPLSFADSKSCGPNPYAACMTAPCKHTNKKDPATGLPLATCTCPTYNGSNQVGNPQILGPSGGKAYSCSPNPYVWSSAYLDLTK